MPTPSEAHTRKQLIDPALAKAGWDPANPTLVGLEIPVDSFDPTAWQTLKRKLQSAGGGDELPPIPSGISDYALYRANGEIIAVVEAKRTSTDPRLAETQAEFYVTELAKRQSIRPFAFLANGHQTYFWDVGCGPKRSVAGFFSPDDLEHRLYLREHGLPLDSVPINTTITGRTYQQEAIRRVCEAFAAGKRRALLVMATGTGKTRTATSLVDLLLRANQARRILFVADRDALVDQALKEGFIAFLPNEPPTRIYGGAIDQTSRLYVSTLQTLTSVFESFSPAFFDLIIFDEVHRSIFNKWNEPLQYFDARIVGLTATPADFIDRNTFDVFQCDGRSPTFLYSYRQAIEERYLVDFDLYAAKTRFQRKGIRGVDLSEEDRNTLIEQGIDPDEIDYAGTDIEKEVSVTGTLRLQWEEIWEVCLKDQGGHLPGKTIVFAMTQNHALRLAETFEEMYPQFPDLVKVITYKSDFKGRLIERFKRDDMPRIAITVDLLETGIDVPEAVNLVFMKPVHSRIKLDQMIGRGTRPHEACHFPERLPNGHKDGFLVLDFWENDFSKPADKEQAQSLPVLVSLFHTRLKLLDRLSHDPATPDSDLNLERTVAGLRALVAQIPTDSFSVRRVLHEIKQIFDDGWWLYLHPNKQEFLSVKVAPLLRFAHCDDVAAATFTAKVERLKLLILEGRKSDGAVDSIRDDVRRLPKFAFEDPASAAAVTFCLTSQQLETATPTQLDPVIDALAPLMRVKDDREVTFRTLNLPDLVEMRGYILLMGGTERVYVQEYRAQVEQRILDLVAADPILGRIGRGERVGDAELIALERTLHQTLAHGRLELTPDNVRKAFGFQVGSLIELLRRLFELDGIPDYADLVRTGFERFAADHPFNADQINFLRAVQSLFLQKRRLALVDLYSPPLTAFGADAADRWFTPAQLGEVLALAERLSVG